MGLDSLSQDTGVPGLAREKAYEVQLAVPPPAEQTQIAAFLDRETAKIDALVAEQRRLMELLKEKRQAVISHAVTRGLNPHAPMKPSGIEWLGDVPAHWEVMPLKRDLDFLTSGSRGWAENYSDEGELFIRITNLTRGSIGLDLSDIQRVAVPDGAEGSRTRVRPGDVLFSITAYLGSVAVVPDALESAYVSQHVALARLRQSCLMPKWVGFVALSVVGQTWFETKSYGGTKIQLSLDDVRDLPIPVPPLEEQSAIVALLETQVAHFDTLTAEAQHAIDLLQERRTALISAAVTGQIDVRQHALAQKVGAGGTAIRSGNPARLEASP
jgi:type I restriction enzyme S subunit